MQTATNHARDAVQLGLELASTHDGLPPERLRVPFRQRMSALKRKYGCPRAHRMKTA